MVVCTEMQPLAQHVMHICTGGVESEKRVVALEKLMAGHAKDLEQRKLLVSVALRWYFASSPGLYVAMRSCFCNVTLCEMIICCQSSTRL
jgi:hypothetical protein